MSFTPFLLLARSSLARNATHIFSVSALTHASARAHTHARAQAFLATHPALPSESVAFSGVASPRRHRSEGDSYDTDGVSFFQIKGNSADDTRAVQVEEVAASLNSGDCFVLLTPGSMFVWQGKGANEAELEVANMIAETLKFTRTTTAVLEGSEPDEFWSAVGGKGEYPSDKVQLDVDRDPQLFHCSNETGTFKMEQIFDFAQADLEEDDIFLLDTFTSIFLWIGSEANATEKKKSLETASAYITAMKYSEDTSIITVSSGSEPPLFTSNFLGWSASATKKFVDPYEAKLAAMQKDNPKDAPPPAAPAAPSAPSAPMGNFKAPGTVQVTYADLKEDKGRSGPTPEPPHPVLLTCGPFFTSSVPS